MSIPIHTAGGVFVRYAEEEDLRKHAAHFELVRNRRGHLKRAILKERHLALTPLSRDGTSFLQQLSNGAVWALRGVVGSRKDLAEA